MTIAAILHQKGREIFHVPPTATIAEVVRVLGEKSIGAVLDGAHEVPSNKTGGTGRLALLWHLYGHEAVAYSAGIQWSTRYVPGRWHW